MFYFVHFDHTISVGKNYPIFSRHAAKTAGYLLDDLVYLNNFSKFTMIFLKKQKNKLTNIIDTLV